MKKILFCLNHPSDFYTFKYVIPRLNHMGYEIKVLLTLKNDFINLPWVDEWDCINLNSGKQKQNFLSSFISMWKFIRQYQPTIVTGTDPVLAHASAFSGARSLFINQLDAKVTRCHAAYKYTKKIISPDSCDSKLFGRKRISYRGCHQLAYLRSKYFQPDEQIKEVMNLQRDKYFIIHLSNECFSIEEEKNSLDDAMVHELINFFEMYGQVFISSDRELTSILRPFKMELAPEKIHDAIYYSELLISDGPTAAAEAAVLGVPSVWISPDVGRIGYMKELEKKYELTFGVQNAQPQELARIIKEILNTPNAREKWKNKRKIMSVETDDVSEFFIDAIRIYSEKKKV